MCPCHLLPGAQAESPEVVIGGFDSGVSKSWVTSVLFAWAPVMCSRVPSVLWRVWLIKTLLENVSRTVNTSLTWVFLPQAAEHYWKADAGKRALFIASYIEFHAHCVALEGCAWRFVDAFCLKKCCSYWTHPRCLLAAAFLQQRAQQQKGKNGEFVEAAVWSHRSS